MSIASSGAAATRSGSSSTRRSICRGAPAIPGSEGIPRYLPGDLIRFPNRTVIIGMFSTALTAYPELPVVSIAKLCRPRKDEMFLILIDQVRRLSTTVRFVESIDELLDKAGQHMRKGV